MAVTVPVLLPLHSTSVLVSESETTGGCVITIFAVFVHPNPSVTVTVYVPANKPDAVAVVCAGIVFQLYVYGPVAPLGFAVAVPFDPPLHETFVDVKFTIGNGFITTFTLPLTVAGQEGGVGY